jgi:hypothetical protein
MSMKKVMKENICRDLKMILKIFLRKKILGDISVEYLGSISGKNQRGSLGKYLDSISGKNLKGITGEISGRYFWK